MHSGADQLPIVTVIPHSTTTMEVEYQRVKECLVLTIPKRLELLS